MKLMERAIETGAKTTDQVTAVSKGQPTMRKRHTDAPDAQYASYLLLSQGAPMLLAGDEFRRTQGGNNNAYCQDSPVSCLDWDHRLQQRARSALYRRLIIFAVCIRVSGEIISTKAVGRRHLELLTFCGWIPAVKS